MEPPTRLCCGQKHFGPVCPDGKVMCILCFERVELKDLNELEDGQKEDVCKACADEEKIMRELKNKQNHEQETD